MKLKNVFLFLGWTAISSATIADNYSEELLITPNESATRADKLYTCEYAGTTRSVSLVYDAQPPLPCEVTYHREQEGKPFEVLWQAQNDAGFCERKTRELLEELKAANWQCIEE